MLLNQNGLHEQRSHTKTTLWNLPIGRIENSWNPNRLSSLMPCASYAAAKPAYSEPYTLKVCLA